MNNLDNKRAVLLRLYILVISLASIGLIFFLYSKVASAQQPISSDYVRNLNKFLEQYKKDQQNFQQYSFFQNYDTVIFKNSTLNQNYKQTINNFSNLTQKQFYSLFNIVQRIASKKNFGEVSRFGYNYSDWSSNRTVIRDQRGFNSSFIFAVLTSIQYRINIKAGAQAGWVLLSAQEVIDCCVECMASRKPEAVLEYIAKYGIFEQQDYPYENSRFDTTPKQCRRQQKTSKKHFISGYETVKNCQALQKQIAIGPLVVGVDGRKFPMYQYSIFNDCQRKTTHYTTIVGMSYDHWKLQNSWGRKWGERGYIRIGPGDTCGVCLRGFSPILKQP